MDGWLAGAMGIGMETKGDEARVGYYWTAAPLLIWYLAGLEMWWL